MLTRTRAGTDTEWPAALADCTGLETLVLSGETAAPLPGGQYLSRLLRLTWLGDKCAAEPKHLAAATALEDLMLGLEPERIAESTILDWLPNLCKLSLPVRAAVYEQVTIVLKLQRRLSARPLQSPVTSHRSIGITLSKVHLDGWHAQGMCVMLDRHRQKIVPRLPKSREESVSDVWAKHLQTYAVAGVDIHPSKVST